MTDPTRRIRIKPGPIIALISKIIRARKDGFTSDELQSIALDLLEISLELIERAELGR